LHAPPARQRRFGEDTLGLGFGIGIGIGIGATSLACCRAPAAPDGTMFFFLTAWVNRQELRRPTSQASEHSAFASPGDWLQDAWTPPHQQVSILGDARPYRKATAQCTVRTLDGERVNSSA